MTAQGDGTMSPGANEVPEGDRPAGREQETSNPARSADPSSSRRWPRWLAVGLWILAALCLLGVGGGWAYLHWRFGQLRKAHFPDGVLKDPTAGEGMNFLLVGSDSRANVGQAETKKFGSSAEVAGQRSDAIVILHVEPGNARAKMLSVPRDLYVAMPGRAGRARINTAYEKGAPQLVAAIHSALDIEINHVVQVDFTGFRRLVDAVGGLNMYVPAPAKDDWSGLDIPTAGCHSFSGEEALAWVRSRHYQYLQAGRWRTDPTSDFGRIQRQQELMRRLLRTAIDRGSRNPLKGHQLIGSAVQDVTVDDKLSAADVLRLTARFRSLSPEGVETLTLPTTPSVVRGAEVLLLKQPEASDLLDRLNGADTESEPAVTPSDVRVRVLNGSGRTGKAAEVAGELQRQSYVVVGTGDAGRFGVRHSAIRYAQGQRSKAERLRKSLVAGADIEEVASVSGADAELVVGTDFVGARTDKPKPATPSGASVPPSLAGAPNQTSC